MRVGILRVVISVGLCWGALGCSALSTRLSKEKVDPVQADLSIAALHEQRGELGKAHAIYARLEKQAPKNPALHHRLAVLSMRQGEIEAAERYFAKARELAPDNVNVISDHGYALFLLDRGDEAEALLQEGLRLEPKHSLALNNLAIIRGSQGNYREALGLFRQSNNDAKAYSNVGYLAAQRGDLQQAIDFYNKALSIDPALRPAAEALVQLARFNVPAETDAGESAETVIAEARPKKPLPQQSDISLVDGHDARSGPPSAAHEVHLASEERSANEANQVERADRVEALPAASKSAEPFPIIRGPVPQALEKNAANPVLLRTPSTASGSEENAAAEASTAAAPAAESGASLPPQQVPFVTATGEVTGAPKTTRMNHWEATAPHPELAAPAATVAALHSGAQGVQQPSPNRRLLGSDFRQHFSVRSRGAGDTWRAFDRSQAPVETAAGPNE